MRSIFETKWSVFVHVIRYDDVFNYFSLYLSYPETNKNFINIVDLESGKTPLTMFMTFFTGFGTSKKSINIVDDIFTVFEIGNMLDSSRSVKYIIHLNVVPFSDPFAPYSIQFCSISTFLHETVIFHEPFHIL